MTHELVDDEQQAAEDFAQFVVELRRTDSVVGRLDPGASRCVHVEPGTRLRAQT